MCLSLSCDISGSTMTQERRDRHIFWLWPKNCVFGCALCPNSGGVRVFSRVSTGGSPNSARHSNPVSPHRRCLSSPVSFISMTKETLTRRTSKRMVIPGSTARRSSQRLAAQSQPPLRTAKTRRRLLPSSPLPVSKPPLPPTIAVACAPESCRRHPSLSNASQEGPSEREIIAVLARMVQGVDLSTPISSRHPLFERILEDLGKHFRMDFRQRRDVKLMISMALCKETTSFWQICSYTAAAPCNQSQAPTTAVLLAPTLPAPVVAASSRVTATGCQEGPSKREIIAVLARMVQGVDLSTSISSRRPLFERILEDLGFSPMETRPINLVSLGLCPMAKLFHTLKSAANIFAWILGSDVMSN